MPLSRNPYTHVSHGNVSSAQTLDLVASQDLTLTGNAVITLPAASAGVGIPLKVEVFQDGTGSRIPSFTVSGGGTLSWLYGVAPSSNTLHTQPSQRNQFLFIYTATEIIGVHRDPKDSGLIHSGGALLQLAQLSFLGDATVTKRTPLRFKAAEVQTTDATLTTILSIPVNPDSLTHTLAMVQSHQSTGAASLAGLYGGYFSRDGTANVTEVAAETTLYEAEDNGASPTVSMAVDTTNQLGLIQVTGVAAETHHWSCYALINDVVV